MYQPRIITACPDVLDGSVVVANSITGKYNWIERELGQPFANDAIICPYGDKSRFARSDRILIDDTPHNIDSWVNAGGIGILHRNIKDTACQLREYGIYPVIDLTCSKSKWCA